MGVGSRESGGEGEGEVGRVERESRENDGESGENERERRGEWMGKAGRVDGESGESGRGKRGEWELSLIHI